MRAYPEIIFGQHPFAGFSTTPDLPIRIADIRELRVDFEAYLEVAGDYNLAFDIWITRELPPTPGPNTTHEIMIWLDRSDWYPSGTDNLVAEAEIEGSEYSVFVHQTETGDGRTWKYVAFAAHADQFSGTVHLDQFLAWLVENEHVSDDHFVAVVELGNEVLDGSSGELWLADFKVTAR